MKRIRRICPKALFRGAKGAALVEVVIAVVILALITASVPPVLLLITESQFSWSEQRIGESLTRNQIEYIKSASYIAGNETNPEPEYATVPVPNESYDIEVVARPVHVDPDTQVHSYLAPGEDEGIQEITVSINHVDRLVVKTRNYKVDR